MGLRVLSSVQLLLVVCLAEPTSGPLDELLAGLKDEEVAARCWAVSRLGELGDNRAVKPLIAKLRDEDRQVVDYAA